MTRTPSAVRQSTPYSVVAGAERTVVANKRELVLVSRSLERAALASPPPAIGATLQDARHLTSRTRAMYAALAERGTAARLFGRGMQAWLAPGVVGVSLDDDDPLVDEWSIVVPGEDPVVFAGTDLRNADCSDSDRCFLYAVSRDPEVVAACARALGL
jgi:hypothetical protein